MLTYPALLQNSSLNQPEHLRTPIVSLDPTSQSFWFFSFLLLFFFSFVLIRSNDDAVMFIVDSVKKQKHSKIMTKHL